MESKFNKDSRVVMKTFHNTSAPDVDTDDSENYWKLIGLTGTVISDEKKAHPAFKDMGPRVVVQFDDLVENYGLHSHNEIPNSLWLFISDLEEIER